jgi:hypothetical protein
VDSRSQTVGATASPVTSVSSGSQTAAIGVWVDTSDIIQRDPNGEEETKGESGRKL